MVDFTVIGLSFDIVGVVLVGFVAPKHSAMVFGTAEPRQKGLKGKLAAYGGWGLILVGFALQILGHYISNSTASPA